MPIEGITQPEMLPVSETLRLRKYDGNHDFALFWYLDPETVWLVDGDREPYTPELLNKMYSYQDAHGELYFIEALENGRWIPVGDVCLSADDFAIVIGERSFRGKGVGRAAASAFSRVLVESTDASTRTFPANMLPGASLAEMYAADSTGGGPDR